MPLLAACSLVFSDGLVVLALIGCLFLIAYKTGRREADTQDFLLGGRSMPGWAVCFSFVATEVSALTIIGVPDNAFGGNWNYLQFFVGSAAARLFVALIFLPHYFHHSCTSIYEYLGQRFGIATQRSGTCLFFITRLLASGVRLYAACGAIALIMDWSLPMTLLFFTLVSIVMIALGGIKAVIWTGVYQAMMFYLVAVAVIVSVMTALPEQWQAGLAEAYRQGKMEIFDFHWDWRKATGFWAGSINAFFVGLVVFGTDQELVQRLLTVKTRRSSQWAIMGTIAAGLPVTVLYLLAGTFLYVLYSHHGFIEDMAGAKQILSDYVSRFLPGGLKGLVLGVIILASIDSPLASLSSSFVTDIYRPLCRPGHTERHFLLVSRLSVVGFGLLLSIIAWLFSPVKQILWFAFEIFSVTGGASLGIFLLGFLTKARGNLSNVIAMIVSVQAMLTLLLLSKLDKIELAWSWLIVLGTAVSFGLGWFLSVFGWAPPAWTAKKTS